MSIFKKLVRKIHLWLGLTTGLLVFIIALTGCIYAFQEEIQNATESYRHVTPKEASFIPPSEVEKIARKIMPDKKLHAIQYKGPDKAIEAIYFHYEPSYYHIAHIDPYDGTVLNLRDEYATFFRFILDGHFYLWLPPEIGQPVVASITLIFLIMMISGLILWIPKKYKDFKSRLRFQWKPQTKWRRKNYDIHQIIGFYSLLFGIFFSITGLVWGFPWFAEAYHKSWGAETSLIYEEPEASPIATERQGAALDAVWTIMRKEYPEVKSIEVHPPEAKNSPIAANANYKEGTYWKIDYRYFDGNTLKELEVDHIYGRLANDRLGDRVVKMNYDLHTGAVLGIGGKVVAFLASLAILILPISGTLIWWGRRKKGLKRKA